MPYALRYTYYETGDPPYCTYDFAGNTRGEALHSYFDALADLTYDRQMEVVAAGSVTVTLRHAGAGGAQRRGSGSHSPFEADE
jgi:hypothetical protein